MCSLVVSKYYHNWFNVVYLSWIAIKAVYWVIQYEYFGNGVWEHKFHEWILCGGVCMYLVLDTIWIIFFPFFTSNKSKVEIIIHHVGAFYNTFGLLLDFDNKQHSIFICGQMSYLMEVSNAMRFIMIVFELNDNVYFETINNYTWYITRLIIHPLAYLRLNYHILFLSYDYNTFVIIAYIINSILLYFQIDWTLKLIQKGRIKLIVDDTKVQSKKSQ